MKQNHLKTVSSEKKTRVVPRFKRLCSYLNRVKGLRISKNKTEGKTGVEVAGPRNSNDQRPKFDAARRVAICSVMEEEDQCHGISLAELRSELITRYLLINVGLCEEVTASALLQLRTELIWSELNWRHFLRLNFETNFVTACPACVYCPLKEFKARLIESVGKMSRTRQSF